MKFVIVGYGRVGMRTARILDEEGHEVFIVDNDHDKVERARKAGFDVVEGDGSNETILEEVGVESADALAGLTGDLNTNFAACMVGKHHDCRTVMRIDHDYREEIYQKYADDVDEIVYPERLGAAGAKTALLGGDFNLVADLTERLQLITISVPEESPAIGKRVSEIDLPDGARIYAHGTNHGAMTIPLPRTSIDEGDSVAVIVEQESVEGVRTALLGTEEPVGA
ncbi:potassium channel family protein [Halalkalicoccus jeotgali]|uniref:TRK potassium uptake system protein n=1 Tax=Halalkalicoccus jeotgali (strain DSM 18796 / CECT 7217 / JCM 14584 / KCTC 4019 / B3) TaxID=795797 RepID=D8J8U2_HALJB|nr:TrkA family potassium uptake protein [Halalkalicoccus jeotgali]ADJ14277.1 TRK potassium uptake system protein [Halalkalicoccus jeotgali B3]ELY40539.1 TRK potassium uptake system protein [Halalkalicoccus jeotgali B3]